MNEEDKQYIDRLIDYLKKLPEGGIIEINSLTNDKDKFIKSVKFVIDCCLPNIEISSDYTKIRKIKDIKITNKETEQDMSIEDNVLIDEVNS